jgi:hypothetical protein
MGGHDGAGPVLCVGAVTLDTAGHIGSSSRGRRRLGARRPCGLGCRRRAARGRQRTSRVGAYRWTAATLFPLLSLRGVDLDAPTWAGSSSSGGRHLYRVCSRGVVRPRPGRSWDGSQARDDAIDAAVEELSRCRPDIYKCEVPGAGDLPAMSLRVRARRITALLDCPWVVLSSGVRPDAFADAVDVACEAGASGFLAGRAIWANAFTDTDPTAYLATHAVGTLRHLIDIVRSHRSGINTP